MDPESLEEKLAEE
jgi:hypothetical protein